MDIVTRAEQLQTECQKFIDDLMANNEDGNEVSYDSAFQTWMFLRLAKMEADVDKRIQEAITEDRRKQNGMRRGSGPPDPW